MGGFNTSVAPPSPVALDIKPPVSTSPLDAVAQMQEFRMRNQAMQTGQLQQQEIQMNLAQRKAINDAYQAAFTPQPDGSMQLDKDKLTSALATAGHGEAIPGIMEGWTKYQQSLGTLQETNQKVAAAEQDAAGNLGATVQAAKNDPTLFHSLLTDAINRKILQPAHYAPMDQALQQSLQQDPTGEQARALVGQWTAQMVSGSPKQQELANARTSAEAAASRATSAATTATTESQKWALELAGRTVPNNQADWTTWRNNLPPALAGGISSMYSPTEAARVQKMAVPVQQQPEFDINTYKARMGLIGNGEYDQFLSRYAQSLGKTPATLTPQEGMASFQQFARYKQDPEMLSLAMSQKRISETVAQLQMNQMPNEADIQNMAQMVVDHTIAPSQFQELRSGRMGAGGVKIMSAVKAIDPTFDMQKADMEYRAMGKTEDDFTSGKEATLVRSNNNAIQHLALLDKARIAMNNGNLPALNAIANWFGIQTGSDKATVFDHIASRVGDEVSKAFIPGGGSAGERTAAAASYQHGMGDQQISSNIRADIALMDSQQRNLVDQYQRGTYNKGAQQLFTPEAMAARDSILGPGARPGAGRPGGQPGAGQRGGAGGAPPLPKTLGAADVGKFYTNAQGQQIRVSAVNPQDPTQFKFDVVK